MQMRLGFEIINTKISVKCDVGLQMRIRLIVLSAL